MNVKEKERQSIFNDGFNAGREVGIIEGMSKNFERSEELTEKEYDKLINFLIINNIELCCYDINKGGFRIRKRIYELQ